MTDIIPYATPMIVLFLGFWFDRRLTRFRTDVESTVREQEKMRGIRLSHLEKKLKLFLNPVLNAIEFDNSIWSRLSAISDSANSYPERLSLELERQFVLENHVRATELVRENFHFIEIDSPLHKSLIQYMRHVAVYKSLRDLNESINPVDLNEEFPAALEEQIRKEYIITREKYNSLVDPP